MEGLYETLHMVRVVCGPIFVTCNAVIDMFSSLSSSTINYSKELPLAQGLKFE